MKKGRKSNLRPHVESVNSDLDIDGSPDFLPTNSNKKDFENDEKEQSNNDISGFENDEKKQSSNDIIGSEKNKYSDSHNSNRVLICKTYPVGVKRRMTIYQKELVNMGRFLFHRLLESYLVDMRIVWAKTTWKTEKRRLEQMRRILEDLRTKGLVESINPTKINKNAIQQLIKHLKGSGIKPVTLGKHIDGMRGFLKWVGNGVMEQMKTRGQLPRIVKRSKEIDLIPIPQKKLIAIQEGAEKMGGWWGSVARLLVWVYPYSGLRVSELRLAHLEDLNTTIWTFYVRHPKGEDTYGRNRTVHVLPPARKHVIRFLKEREQKLEQWGQDSIYLIPMAKNDTDIPFQDAVFRKIKKGIARWSKADFNLRQFRPTFAQNCKDRGVSIEAVGKILGHTSTVTTEKYYARMRDNKAGDELLRAWDDKKDTDVLKPQPELDTSESTEIQPKKPDTKMPPDTLDTWKGYS